LILNHSFPGIYFLHLLLVSRYWHQSIILSLFPYVLWLVISIDLVLLSFSFLFRLYFIIIFCLYAIRWRLWLRRVALLLGLCQCRCLSWIKYVLLWFWLCARILIIILLHLSRKGIKMDFSNSAISKKDIILVLILI